MKNNKKKSTGSMNKNTERNIVRIRCNPYKQLIEYYRFDREIEDYEKIVASESPFSKEAFQKCIITQKGYEILNYMNQIYNPGNPGLDIIFEGTKEDYEFFQELSSQYFSKNDINVIKGETELISAPEVKKQIEDIFKSMEKMFEEYPDQEIYYSVKKFNESIRPTIPICIMGLYSAGKSAFINSLLGVELLPSASDPTTAKTYKISSSEKNEIRFTYTEKNQNSRVIILTFEDKKYIINQSSEIGIVKELEAIKKYNSIEERMYHALEIINNYDRLKNKNTTTDKRFCVSDLIEVTLPIHSEFLSFDKYDFVFYDTPGSNSASNSDDTEVLKKAMGDQTNGLPIFITSPDNMDGGDNERLRATFDELGNALDKSNLMIVVNKADEKSDDTLAQKKENIDDLVVSKLNPAGIYFVSAVMGLGFKKLLVGNSIKGEDENDEGEPIIVTKPKFIDSDYRNIFDKNKKQFNSKKSPFPLYTYNIIPQNQFDKYNATNIDTKYYSYRNSGLHSIETVIDEFASKYALYNKCRNAAEYLSVALDKLKTNIGKLKQDQQKMSNQLKSQMTEKEKSVLNELNLICGEKKFEYTNQVKDKLSVLINKKTDTIEKEIDKTIETYWENTKGQSSRKIIVTNAVNACLKKDVENTWEISKYELLNLWEKNQEGFKKVLIERIVGSSILDETQKLILKDAIIKINVRPNYSMSFHIEEKDIIGRFMFFKYVKTEVAHKKYMDGFSEGCMSVNNSLLTASTNALDIFINEVENQFTTLVPKYNKTIIKIRSDFEKCNTEIKYKTEQEKEINNNISQIYKITLLQSY